MESALSLALALVVDPVLALESALALPLAVDEVLAPGISSSSTTRNR